MRTLIQGGTLITPKEQLHDHTLVIEGQSIQSIEPGMVTASEGDKVFDARAMFITPGLIDIHVHGALGNDVMDGSTESLHSMARFFAQHGVTGYLPTTLSAPPEWIQRAIESVAGCRQPEDGARHLGVHIEGPYLNPDHRGAQPVKPLRDPDPQEYRAWLETGAVRLITLAPERSGAIELMDCAVPLGVEFAVGHSGASYDQVLEAADHGLRQATHTFNGMLGLHHRRPGTVGGVLTDDRIYAQVIPDGVHLHPAIIKLLIRAKGVHRTILITDSISPAGLQDGEYQLSGLKIVMKNGVSRTPSGGLAGSTLTMDEAVRKAMAFAEVSLPEAITMATAVPAEAMGWSPRKGSLAPGSDADIAIFDSDLKLRTTFIAGRVVHQAA